MSYFVCLFHSISQSIQVDNILVKVLKDTLNALKSEEKREDTDREKESHEKPSEENWITLYSTESGYYRNFETKGLLQTASEHDLIIKILKPRGSFILKGAQFININKEIDDNLKKMILNTFIFYQEEYIINILFTASNKHLKLL